jgi:hypothetical protein
MWLIKYLINKVLHPKCRSNDLLKQNVQSATYTLKITHNFESFEKLWNKIPIIKRVEVVP